MLETVRDELISLVYTALKADPLTEDIEILYEDTDIDKPKSLDVSWCRISVKHVSGKQATLANQVNQRRYRRNGLLIVQLFTPIGTGLSLADKYAKIILDSVEGKSTTSNVWLRNCRTNEIGREGSWQQTNIFADFEYDEEK
jgi:hypothetical protein